MLVTNQWDYTLLSNYTLTGIQPFIIRTAVKCSAFITFVGGIYSINEVHPIHHYPVDKEQSQQFAAVGRERRAQRRKMDITDPGRGCQPMISKNL